jgi:hypothetical protein
VVESLPFFMAFSAHTKVTARAASLLRQVIEKRGLTHRRRQFGMGVAKLQPVGGFAAETSGA